jgi:hypothetical protein
MLWILLLFGQIAFVHAFLAGRSFYAERYLTPAFPAFCFLVALGVDYVANRVTWPAWLALVGVLILACWDSGKGYAAFLRAPPARGFWRDRVAELETFPGKKFVFFDSGTAGQTLAYNGRRHEQLTVFTDRWRFYPPLRDDVWDPQRVERTIQRALPDTRCFFYFVDSQPQGREHKGVNSPYVKQFLPLMQRLGFERVQQKTLRDQRNEVWQVHGFCARAR